MRCIIGLCLLAVVGSAEFLPARTAASRWTGDVVLCYMDSRSTDGPAKDLFTWTPERFGRLLAYHNDSSDRGGGEPVDTLFDSFLLSGDDWYDGKNIWPFIGSDGMNMTDWLGFLNMSLEMGAAQLDLAAANISARLPYRHGPSCDGLRPSVILSIPYPDPRVQSFGSIDGSGRSLNFTLVVDRISACRWFVKTAYDSWNAKGFKQVQLTGFYWYLEELLVDPPAQPRLFSDDLLIKSVAQAIKATDPGLLFAWIPYYKGPGTPWLDQWEDLGFDYVTLQPNYAFNNVTAADRFGVVRELAVKNRLGVEIEIPNGVRNALTGGWQGNFKAYVSEVERWHDSVMRTYYYGNVFVDVFAANSTTFEYYTKLYRFVKGIRGANASVPTAATAVAGDSAPHRTMHAAGDRATFSLPPRMR